MAPAGVSASVLGLLGLGLLGLGEGLRRPHAEGSCACLNWKEVYESKKASCGDALEHFTYTRAVGEHVTTWHFCEGASAYDKQDDRFCTKVAQGSSLPDEPASFADAAWCYVPSECADLNGGAAVNQNVSWKVCRAGQDSFLADLHPASLLGLARRNGQDIGLLTQMAYRVLKQVTFGEARELFRAPLHYKLPKDTRDLVSAIIDSGKPTILCERAAPAGSPDSCGAGEVFVVAGRDVWRMETMQCRTGEKGCTRYAH